jgi:diguanylate cyclase (GGDEF)-like protein
MVSALALVAGIIASGQVRFTTALVACLTCALAFPMVILAFPAALPLHKTPEIPLAAIIGFVVLCLAARRNEIVRRSEYLHRLRHEIGERELHALNRELTRLSATDALTGLANRRHFVDEARRVWDDRDQAPFALAIVDVDDFKAFNDAAGHAAGDRCLSAVAEALNGALRHDSDRAARYGGEEFAILFPGAVNDALPELGERLRAAVEAMRMPHPGRPGSVVTVSVGITWQKGRNGDLDRRLNEADRLMYLAKERGRNRVCAGTSSGEADGGWPAPEQDSGATSPEGVAKTAL